MNLLKKIKDRVWSKPLPTERELAVIEFLELSDAEQKSIIFRALLIQDEQITWLVQRTER